MLNAWKIIVKKKTEKTDACIVYYVVFNSFFSQNGATRNINRK